jgi:hypothetical protein
MREKGNHRSVGEWPRLIEQLVELDIAIEDLDSWATDPADVEELKGLEALRDDVRSAVARGRVSKRLHTRLEEGHPELGSSPATVDPRD